MLPSSHPFRFASILPPINRRVLVGLAVSLAGAWCSHAVAAEPAASAPSSVRVIRFDDVKPEGAKLTTCWDAVAIDDRQRVYIAFSDQNNQTPHDTVLLRYDTRSDTRELLGTLRQISRDEGNLAEGETIAKIHVPFQEYRGKFYFSSHDYHSYKGPEDLAQRRGGHFYSYDLKSGKFADLSKTDAGGVSVPQQGIIGLTILRKQNKLAGFTFPHGDILIHDLDRGTTTHHPGVAEHRQGGKPTRQIFATDKGKVYFSYYDKRSSPLYAFDVHTGAVETTKYRYHFGMIYGAIPTRDGSRIYVVDLLGNLYVFHTAEERLEDLGSLLPSEQIAAGVKVEICYALVLSRDEKKLYTFPSRLSEAPALRIYEHDLASGQKRQVADFTASLNGSTSDADRADRNGRITGSGVIDEKGRMYFGYHESGDEGRNGVLLQVTLAGEN
jgi:hypothetical protein